MTISIEVEVTVISAWVDACRHEAARNLRAAADRLEHHDGNGVADFVTEATAWLDQAETLMDAWEAANPDDVIESEAYEEIENAEAVSSGTEATPSRIDTALDVERKSSR